jgi:hypothetical protein
VRKLACPRSLACCPIKTGVIETRWTWERGLKRSNRMARIEWRSRQFVVLNEGMTDRINILALLLIVMLRGISARRHVQGCSLILRQVLLRRVLPCIHHGIKALNLNSFWGRR